MESYNIDIHATETQIVGKLDIAAVKKLTGIEFPVAEVHMYPGALKHIRRQGHGHILDQYGHLIPDMISNPDFIGKHPSVPNSLELVKQVTEHLLLAIALDPSGYLYVSSLYDLNNGEFKVQKRLKSGRLVAYKP